MTVTRERQLVVPAAFDRKRAKKAEQSAPVSDFVLAALRDAGRKWEQDGQFEGFITRAMSESNARSWASGIRNGKVRVRGGVELEYTYETYHEMHGEDEWYVHVRVTGKRA